MKIFATVTPASVPKTKNTVIIATFYAAILTVLAVAQLFSFEELLGIFANFDLFSTDNLAVLFGALIVVAEVFALPFLLRMKLSPAMRIFSMFWGWFVAAFWFVVALWAALSETGVTNLGMLGDIVELVPGWWAVFVSIALGTLSAWSSWGMWPKFQAK